MLRWIKRAKLFEIQRIARRIKMLERKQGTMSQLKKNQRRCERLVTELEMIKELNLKELASEIQQMEPPGLSSELPKDPAERAKWRLLSSKSLQQELYQLRMAEQQVKSQAQMNDLTALKAACKSESKEACDKEEAEEKVGEEEEKEEEDREEEEDSQFQSENVSTDSDTVSNESELSQSDHMSSMNLKRREPARLPRESPKKCGKRREQYSSPLDTSSGCTKKRALSNRRGEGTGLESVFVDSLSARVTSRPQKPQGKAARPKGQKNRLGQRARRRRWELRFGADAKHLQNQVKHKHKKQWQKGDAGKLEPARKAASLSNPLLMTEALHPSWVASKKRRAKETAIVEYEGQRTVFSD